MNSKYRGKDIKTGNWIYGYHIPCPTDKTAYIVPDGASIHRLRVNNLQPTLVGLIQVHPASVGMWTGPPENDIAFYDGDIIEYILAFPTSQTHIGDNIPGGSYTEPDEPFVYLVRGAIYYDECRAMWDCSVITKEYGADQRPQWVDLDSDYVPIIGREEYSIGYIKSLCSEDCETCKEDCWILEQTKSKDWDELKRKMNALWVIGNLTDTPELLGESK